MKNSTIKTTLRSALAVSLLTALPSDAALIAAGSWIDGKADGSNNIPNLTQTTAGDLDWGSGTTSPGRADNTGVAAAFPTATLSEGESITFSGNLTIVSGTRNELDRSDGYRFGIYDTNGSSDTQGWLGYWAGLSVTAAAGDGSPAGTIQRRIPGSATHPFTGGGVNPVGSPSSTVPDELMTIGETYSFSLTYTRTGANELTISHSIVNSNNANVVENMTIVDSAPNTFTFDRVGILAGSRSDVHELQLRSVDVSVVPEPSTGLLALGGALFLAFRRRK